MAMTVALVMAEAMAEAVVEAMAATAATAKDIAAVAWLFGASGGTSCSTPPGGCCSGPATPSCSRASSGAKAVPAVDSCRMGAMGRAARQAVASSCASVDTFCSTHPGACYSRLATPWCSRGVSAAVALAVHRASAPDVNMAAASVRGRLASRGRDRIYLHGAVGMATGPR